MTAPTNLPAWVYGPFELLVHAELHYRAGKDFDRRMALISFDNAIEVAIRTYLSLHPVQRKNKTYVRADVEKWLQNFPAQMTFLEEECSQRGVVPAVDAGHMIYYHSMRNEQYHEGQATVPTGEALQGIRAAALWVFGFLYDVADVEQRLQERITSMAPPEPEHENEWDELLDNKYEKIKLGNTDYLASKLLFAYDPIAYKELALSLLDEQEAEAQQTLSATDQLKLEYWIAFCLYVKAQRPDLTFPKAQAIHWMDFNIFFKRGFFLGARINTRQNVLTFGFYNTLPKAVFRHLHASKTEIEAKIGAVLDWDENPSRKQSQAELRLKGVNVKDRSQWPEQHAWFLKHYELFSQAFAEPVHAVDVTSPLRGS